MKKCYLVTKNFPAKELSIFPTVPFKNIDNLIGEGLLITWECRRSSCSWWWTTCGASCSRRCPAAARRSWSSANQSIIGTKLTDQSIIGTKLTDQSIIGNKLTDQSIIGNKLTNQSIIDNKLTKCLDGLSTQIKKQKYHYFCKFITTFLNFETFDEVCPW